MAVITRRILLAASEAYPLVKTGGLADVAGSLGHALQELDQDVWLVLPAYRSVLNKLSSEPTLLTSLTINQFPVRLLRTTLPQSRVPVILVDCPALYDRAGTPYLTPEGDDWPDNAERFAVFCRVIAMLAMDQLGLNWRADIVHLNDWQTGLVPVYLQGQANRPGIVFTIHNLAYQGFFDRLAFERLQLSEYFWHHERLEYHGGFAFIKGGLVFADRINTVSPNYANEIQTPAFGHGLDGLLQYRASKLSGILNGVDDRVWNPQTDSYIAQTFSHDALPLKQKNKLALQQRMQLPVSNHVLLLGVVSRLAEQKGIDLIIDSLPHWINHDVQLAVLGSGDKALEQRLAQLAKQFPDKIAVQLGYDEGLAHQIEAGIDAFLMPSRFEPCGLNQMYSQLYGSLPIVSPVGGLRDTVQDGQTGFVMPETSMAAFTATVLRAIQSFNNKTQWLNLQQRAMQQDYSWRRSAQEYLVLYQQSVLT